MNAGMPGTGLGGLFYLVLALVMPLHELYLTARGRSSRERWRLVLTQLAVALGIIATVVVVVWVVRELGPGQARGATVTALAAPVVASVVLAVLALVVRVWALLVRTPEPPTA